MKPEEEESKAKLSVEMCVEEEAERIYAWSFSRDLRKFLSAIIILK